MNRITRIVSRVTKLFIIAFMMFANLTITNLNVAALTPTSEFGNIEEPNPGSVHLNKVAVDIGGGQYEVTLTVTGIPVVTSTDIVLVVDTSGSMKGGKMSAAITAAKNFIDTIIAKNQGHRIAIVSFAETPQVVSDFSTNATSLKNAIDTFSADGGTHLEGGIYLARQLLASASSIATNKKSIVVLGDGSPTFGYTFNLSYTGPVSTSVKNGSCKASVSHDNQANLDNYSGRYDFNYNNTTVGTGSSIGFSTDEEYSYTGQCTIGGNIVTDTRTFSEELDFTLRDSVLWQAQQAKTAGVTIYSVGLSVDATGSDILNSIQNGGYYNGNTDNLAAIYAQIASQIMVAATGATLSDMIGNNFTYQGLSGTSGTLNTSYDTATRILTWNIGNVGSAPMVLTYILKINDGLPSGTYPTNEYANLSYTNVLGQTSSKNFPKPVVNVDTGKIVVRGYATNAAGLPINSEGVVISNPIYLYENDFVSGGSTNLVIGNTYSVPAQTVASYALLSGQTSPQSVTVSTNGTIFVDYKYTKSVSYSVKHMFGSVVLDTETGTAGFSTSFTALSKNISGYVLASGQPLQITRTLGMTLAENTFEFQYIPSDVTVTVQYIRSFDNAVINSFASPAATLGSSVTVNGAATFEYSGVTYNRVGSATQTVTNIPGTTVKFYYDKQANYQFNFLLIGPNTVLQSPVSGSAQYLSTVNHTAPAEITVDGIVYSISNGTAGSLTLSVDGSNVYNYYYQVKGGLSYTVEYRRLSDNQLLNSESFNSLLNVGNSFTFTAPATYNGYNLVTSSSPVTITLDANVTNNKIVVLYDKQVSYKVEYRLANNTLVPGATQPSLLNVSAGSTVSVSAAPLTIGGYRLSTTLPFDFKVETDGSIIPVYYVPRTDFTYKVRYIDSETNLPLLTEKTVSNVEYLQSYLEDSVAITGFTPDATSKSVTIQSDDATNVVTFSYTRNSYNYSVAFGYYVEGVLNYFTLDKVNPEVKTAKFNDSVTEYAYPVVGYTPLVLQSTQTISSEGQQFLFIYTPNNYAVTVEYRDAVTHAKINPDKAPLMATFNSVVHEEAITIFGYTAQTPITVDHTVNSTDNTIVFEYLPQSVTYSVYYKLVDTSTDVASALLNQTADYGTSKTVTAPAISGYNIVGTPSYEFLFNEETLTYETTFYYSSQAVAYTVEYLDEDGNELVAPVTLAGVFHGSASADALPLIGYTPDAVTKSIDDLQLEGNVITFVYSANAVEYTVRYLDEDGNELVVPVILAGVFHGSASADALSLIGYTPDAASKSIDDLQLEGNVITFNYSANAVAYTVRYLDEDGNDLVAPATLAGVFHGSATANALAITGYTPDAASKSIPDLQLEGNIITFNYSANAVEYTVEYLDEDGNELVSPVILPGVFHGSVTEYAKYFAGYTADDASKSILDLQLEDNVITFVYSANAVDYTVRYLDENGNELIAPVTLSGVFHGMGSADALAITGYTPDAASKSIDDLQLEGNVITFVYSANAVEYTVRYVDQNGNELVAPVTLTGVFHGSATANALAITGYTPDAASKSINDLQLEGNVITFNYTVIVVPTNIAPTSTGATYTLVRGTSITRNLTAADAEGNAVTYTLVTGPNHGTVTLNATTGRFTYTNDGLNLTPDTFTFRVNDGKDNSNIARITLTIIEPAIGNTAPTATDISYTTPYQTALTKNLNSLVSDANGDPLTFIIVTQPTNGTLTIDANGNYTYTPKSGFSGNDSFTYLSNDGKADSNIGKVSIKVEAEIVVTPEPTPQANLSTWYWLAGLLGLLLFFILALIRRPRPQINDVVMNPDGTYTVSWGYLGPRLMHKDYDRDESVFEVLAGNAIKLPEEKQVPYEFDRGQHENLFETIVDDSTVIRWTIKKKEETLNKEVIEKILNNKK